MSDYSKIEINQLSTLHGHAGPVHKILKGRSENELISCGGDGWALSWYLDQSGENELIYRADSPILTACIDIQSGLLILGDKSGILHFYSLESNTLIRQVFHHPRGVVSFLSTRNGLYSCGMDGKVSLWDTVTGQVENSLHISRFPLVGCAQAPDGSFVAANERGTVYIMDNELNEITKSYSFSHGDITTINLKGEIVHVGFVSGKVIGITRKDGKPACESDPHWFSVTDISTLGTSELITVGSDGKINVLNFSDLTKITQGPEEPENSVMPAINTLLVIADKRMCYVGGDDRTIRVFKFEKAK